MSIDNIISLSLFYLFISVYEYLNFLHAGPTVPKT